MKTLEEIIVDNFYEKNTRSYQADLVLGRHNLKFEFSQSEINNSIFKAIFCIANATRDVDKKGALDFLDRCIADGKKVDNKETIKCIAPRSDTESWRGPLEKCEIGLLHFILGKTGEKIDFETKSQLIRKLHSLGVDFNLKPKYLEGKRLYPGLIFISKLSALELFSTSVTNYDDGSLIDNKNNFPQIVELLIGCGAKRSESGINLRHKKQFEKAIGKESYKTFHDLVTTYSKDKVSKYKLPAKTLQESYKDRIARRYQHNPYIEGDLVIEELGELTDVVDKYAVSVGKGEIKKVKVGDVTYIAKPVNNVASEFGSALFRMASNEMFTTKHDKLHRDRTGKLWALSKFDREVNGTNFLDLALRSKLAFDPMEANPDFMVSYARMMGVLHVFGEGDSNPRNFFVNKSGKIVKIDNSFFENSAPSFTIRRAVEENPNGYRIMGCAQANYFFRAVILGKDNVNEYGFMDVIKYSSDYKKLADDHTKLFTEGVSDEDIELLKERIKDPKIKTFFKAFIEGVKDSISLAQDDRIMGQHIARYSDKDRDVAERCRAFFSQNATEAQRAMAQMLALTSELDKEDKGQSLADKAVDAARRKVISPKPGSGTTESYTFEDKEIAAIILIARKLDGISKSSKSHNENLRACFKSVFPSKRIDSNFIRSVKRFSVEFKNEAKIRLSELSDENVNSFCKAGEFGEMKSALDRVLSIQPLGIVSKATAGKAFGLTTLRTR